MTLQEKLDLIDEEIRKLHLFCTKSGYSSRQIERFAHPFFARDVHDMAPSIWPSGKAWKRRIVSLSTVVIAAALLFRFDPAYQLVCAVSKKGAIEVLPVWDWTQIYDSRCWVDNPLYRHSAAPGLQIQDCGMCESTERVDKVPAPGLTDDVLMENYVKRDVPVIVTGASPLKGDITLHRLAQLYSEHPVLKRYFSCGLASNVRQTSGDHVELLRSVVDDKLDKFYAKWENCNRDAAKAFRSLYRRPQFLPSAVSVSASNWVYVASNYTGKLYKPVDVAQSLVIFMQVKGESRVKMEPWSPCDQICSHFVEALEEGDVLIATDFLWKVDYLPTNKSENIAIAFGGSFD